MKIRTAIFGGSGYGGSELLRILLFHPSAEIAPRSMGQVVAGEFASLEDRVNRGNSGFVPISHGDGDRAIQFHNRRRRRSEQQIV